MLLKFNFFIIVPTLTAKYNKRHFYNTQNDILLNASWIYYNFYRLMHCFKRLLQHKKISFFFLSCTIVLENAHAHGRNNPLMWYLGYLVHSHSQLTSFYYHTMLLSRDLKGSRGLYNGHYACWTLRFMCFRSHLDTNIALKWGESELIRPH